MALDSIYRVKEVKEYSKKHDAVDYKKSMDSLRRMIDSLKDIDQEWIRENEAKEFKYTIPVSEPEPTEDELQEFKKLRDEEILREVERQIAETDRLLQQIGKIDDIFGR